MEKSTLMLRCTGEHEITLVLVKVHQRACGSDIGGQALAHKLLRVGY